MAVRRVRRIIRRIDPWTVLKVSIVFNAIAALTFVLGTWVTWSLALRRGIPDRVVDIFESLTLTVTVEGELYFRIVVLLAIIGAILMTAFMTLGAVLYNLIADLVGGVEIAVLEETYQPAATRTKLAPAPAPSRVAVERPMYRHVSSTEVAAPEAPVEDEPEPEGTDEPDPPMQVPAASEDESNPSEAAGDPEIIDDPLSEIPGDGEAGADEGEAPRVRAG